MSFARERQQVTRFARPAKAQGCNAPATPMHSGGSAAFRNRRLLSPLGSLPSGLRLGDPRGRAHDPGALPPVTPTAPLTDLQGQQP
jgi:hypothetical protein